MGRKLTPSAKEKLLAIDLEAVQLFSPGGANKWFYNVTGGYKFKTESARTYQPYEGVKMHMFSCVCYASSVPYTLEFTSEDLMKEYHFGNIRIQ